MRGAPYLPIYKFQLEFQISFIACTFLVYVAHLFIENGSTASPFYPAPPSLSQFSLASFSLPSPACKHNENT